METLYPRPYTVHRYLRGHKDTGKHMELRRERDY